MICDCVSSIWYVDCHFLNKIWLITWLITWLCRSVEIKNVTYCFIYLRKREKLHWGALEGSQAPGHKFYKRGPAINKRFYKMVMKRFWNQCVLPGYFVAIMLLQYNCNDLCCMSCSRMVRCLSTITLRI